MENTDSKTYWARRYPPIHSFAHSASFLSVQGLAGIYVSLYFILLIKIITINGLLDWVSQVILHSNKLKR